MTSAEAVKTELLSHSGGQTNATGMDSSAKPTIRFCNKVEYSRTIRSDVIRATRGDFSLICSDDTLCCPLLSVF